MRWRDEEKKGFHVIIQRQNADCYEKEQKLVKICRGI